MDQGNKSQVWGGNTQTAINCDTFWLQTLGTHVIVLWQIQKFMLLYSFCFVLCCIWGHFPSISPGGIYSEGRFNGWFFPLRVCGASYNWKNMVPSITDSRWKCTFQISPCFLLIHVIAQFCYPQVGIFYQIWTTVKFRKWAPPCISPSKHKPLKLVKEKTIR